MKLSSLALPLFASAMTLTSACAQTTTSSAQAAGNASIPFANNGGIQDWRSEGTSVIYIEASNGRWYKATLLSPSPDLPFAQAIGFDTGPTGTLDKFSTIVIQGQRYPIATLERMAGPPPKKQVQSANN